MAKAKLLTLPSLLNYTRSIIPSNGVFYYLQEARKHPIVVTRQTVRGTISNYSNVYKKGKQENEQEIAKKLDPANANIQTIDVCYLPDEVDTFYLAFSLTITHHSAAPGACNDADYHALLTTFTKSYRDKQGFDELAGRYLQNLINARWFWRNRYAANKQVEITINGEKETRYAFESKPDLEADYRQQKGYADLKNKIAQALAGESDVLRLSVVGSGILGFGQEVYPSQEFVEGKKDKTLASVKRGDDTRQAAMHSQKIGNAIRTIDDWHSKAAEYGKIAIEPYGVVPARSEAVRLPKTKDAQKRDLYSSLKTLDVLTQAVNDAESGKLPDEAHYVMACLIRGGVYSGESKK